MSDETVEIKKQPKKAAAAPSEPVGVPETSRAPEEAPALVEDENGKSDPDTSHVVTVTVATKHGDRFVIEWRTPAGSLRRAWSDVLVTSASENELEALEPYGDDLSKVMHGVAWNRADLVDELHRMGVWRISEINANVVQTLFAGYARLATSDTLKRLNEAKATVT